MFVPFILILLALGLMIFNFVGLTKHSSIAVHTYMRINCYFALVGSILYLLGLIFSIDNGVVFDGLIFVYSLAYLNIFVALFTMSFMICIGIVRSFIQPINIGTKRIEMVERRFSEWYGLHVISGNRIQFGEGIFHGLSKKIITFGSDNRVRSYFIGVFIATFFFGLNTFYFVANVLSQMSIIDRLAPSISMVDAIEPIIESFQYLVVWSIGIITTLFGIESLLIALATYELVMLIFFIKKWAILQRHTMEATEAAKPDEMKKVEEHLNWMKDQNTEQISMFWKRTVFGLHMVKEVKSTFGELYHLDGNHWSIDIHSRLRHIDKEKLTLALDINERIENKRWGGITESDLDILRECGSWDIEIFNNEHSITIHGESKEIIEMTSGFPSPVLKIIKLKILSNN
jgi:hypothetical protein